MLLCATERASIAWLQRPAMHVQTLDTALLIEQFLLVLHLRVHVVVLFAQGVKRFVLRFDLDLALLQLRCQRGLLTSEFTALSGECFELLPVAQAVLAGLRLLAQGGQRLPGQSPGLFGFGLLVRGVGGGAGLFGSSHRRVTGDELVATFGLLFFQFFRGHLLRRHGLLQLLALVKLLAPDAQTFAQPGALRMSGAKVVKLLVPLLCQRPLRLRLFGDSRGDGVGAVMLLVMRGLLAFVLAVQRLQRFFAGAAGGFGVLPRLMQRLQRLRRFAVGQAVQLRGGGFKCSVGGPAVVFSRLSVVFALRQIEPPLALGLCGLVLALHVYQFGT